MPPQSSPEDHHLQIERTKPGPVRELAMKFNKDTTVSPHPNVFQSFMTPPQSPAGFQSPRSTRSRFPKEAFLTPLQSPKINLVAQRANKFGKQMMNTGRRPSFIQKDPNNPFNNSILWNTDESTSLDEPEVPAAESMPEVGNVSAGESVSKQQHDGEENALKDDDNTSITVPLDDSSFTATNLDDSTIRDETALHYKLHESDPQTREDVKKIKKDKNEAKKSKTKSSEKDTTTKSNRSKSKDRRRITFNVTPPYTCWDFGKKKNFQLPPMSTATVNAAILIQRMMRGWWKRLHFRVQLLTYRLENKEHLTSKALEKVWTETEEKKNKFYDIMKGKMDRRQDRELEKTVTCRSQGQQIIEYLRKDNKKIREDTDRIKRKFREQKEQLARLEATSDHIAENVEVLQVHAKRFQESHEQLTKIEPVYKAKVMALEDSYVQAKAYCDTEHICKLKYLNAMEKVVTMVQDRCTNRKLVDKVVDLMLSIDVD